MDAPQIQQALKEQGLTYTDVGEALGVTANTVVAVVHRRGTSRRVARGIAVAIGKPVKSVFPDKPQYHRDRKKAVADLKKKLAAA